MSRRKSSPISFSRRGFLAGLGAAALAPYLPILNASGQENLMPKRLVLFYTPHGTVKTQWKPTGSESSFTLPRLLAPLAKHQAKINVLSGVNMVDTGVGAPHTKGLPLVWTGSKLLDETTFTRPDGSGGPTYGWNSSLSVDQFVANSIGMQTAYKSLEFGVRTGSSSPTSRMIYTDARKPVAPATDPWSQFTRLFAGTSDAEAAERLSALKLARDELARLSPQIASADRQKIEAHTASLNDLEKRLNDKSKLCAGPTLAAKVDSNNVANTVAVVDSQIQLIVAALACDLTRVASFQYSIGDNDGGPYPFLGINDGHHLLTHAADSDTASWEKVMKIRVWYAQKFASLLDQLDAIPEGNGTLLDNCLVVWGSELGMGNTHSFKSTPFVTAGGAGGAFTTGRYLEYNEKSYHNGLLVAICQAMGLTSTTKFGNVDPGTGPLTGLLT
ncbi:MAG: Tat (Twin-arginine translocation) pathway signal sequence domain protein [Myxococcaceae bacterium]|nr:Tat (Twin-arginine translocation) pathway signal sequence domain protein [Myxococcaceae bacterium]